MLLLILILYIFFASTFTLSKAAMLYVAPFFFVGIRMVFAGAALLGYQYFFNRAKWGIERKHYWLFMKLAFFAIFASYGLEFASLEYVASFKVAMLFNMSPFITTVISYIVLSERLSKKQLIGLLIGFIGILPMIGTTVESENTAGCHFGFISLPEIMLFGAVFAACYGWIIFKVLVSQCKYSPIMVNGVSMFIGGAMALVVSLLKEWPVVIHVLPNATDYFYGFITSSFYASIAMGLIYIGMLILIGNFLCNNLYGFLLKKYSATFLSFAGFITPLFAALFGWFLLKESITWHFFASLCMTVGGLFLFYQDELLSQKNKFL